MKKPDDIDKHVGTRVRTRRITIGMSQEKLGDALGVTFQQVQKYEKGANRVSASRLQQIASVLGVSIAYLYEGAPGAETATPSGLAEGEPASYAADPQWKKQDIQLLAAFGRIRDPLVRRRVLDLVEALAGEAPPAGSSP